MSKKIMNGRVKNIMKCVDSLHDQTLNLLDESMWVSQEGPSAELLEKREEIEEVLSNIVVFLMGFSSACTIDLDDAIVKKLKGITEFIEAGDTKGDGVATQEVENDVLTT